MVVKALGGGFLAEFHQKGVAAREAKVTFNKELIRCFPYDAHVEY